VVLKLDIQSTGTHDSIEDARTALQLYEEYQRMDHEGVFEDELEDIYLQGKRLVRHPLTLRSLIFAHIATGLESSGCPG